jgi:hypothetical protein
VVIKREKTGFGMPVGHWMPGALADDRAQAYGYGRDWACYVAAHQPTSSAPARLAA